MSKKQQSTPIETLQDLFDGVEFVIEKHDKEKSYCRFKKGSNVIERVNFNAFGADIKVLKVQDISMTELMRAKIVPKGTYKKHFEALAEFVKDSLGYIEK